MQIQSDAKQIIAAALKAAQPDTAVQKALTHLPCCTGRIILVAAGKAAWAMANAASQALGGRIDSGIVITKYGHAQGPIQSFLIREAGHPVPDAASYAAAQEAIQIVQSLTQQDLVLFLLSGGGSALF